MFFSAEKNGFYALAVHGDAIPADAVEITADCHAALMAAQASGKVITVDADGFPIASDPPLPTHDELMGALRAERDRRINAVSWRCERHARELRMGLAPTEDIAALDAYIQTLADLPEATSDPAAPVWPVEPGSITS